MLNSSKEREERAERQRKAKNAATKHFLQPTASAEAMGETSRLISENVVGWGIGIKASGEDALLIHVEEEFPDLKIPDGFGELPTEIVEVGQPTAYLTANPIEGYWSVLGGSSIGHPQIGYGTLGCLVEKDGNHYILSNNHVIAATNGAVVGEPVVYPGPLHGGSADRGDTIAALELYQTIDFSQDQHNPNRIDAAIAKVGDCWQTVVSPEIICIGVPRSTLLSERTLVQPGQYVRKYGATIGATEGVIEAIDFAIPTMIYNVENRQHPAFFNGQIAIKSVNSEPFSEPGDSGSLIVDAEYHKPIGLLFGGSRNGKRKVTYANPIELVLEHYDVTIIGS